MVASRIPLLKRLRLEQEAVILGGVVLLVLALVFGSPFFLDPNNINSLQTAVTPNLIVGIGMMVLFITGMFDLSVGAVMGLAGTMTALALQGGHSLPLAIALGLGLGVVIGCVNGVLVAYAGINHLIVTLGVMYMTRGVIEITLKGEGIAGFTSYPAGFLALGNHKTIGLYDGFIAVVVFAAMMEFILRRTGLGRSLYFIGGNPDAARLVGFATKRVRLVAFIFSGFMSAAAGLFATAHMGMANRYLGVGLEMNIIIACLVGGGSMAGGKGSVFGATLGVVFISFLTDAFNLFEVPAEWQSSVIGAILVAIVIFDGAMILRKRGYSWRSILGAAPRRKGEAPA